MKKIKTVSLILAAATVFSLCSNLCAYAQDGKTYIYVSTNGSDSNSGDKNSPLRTPEAARIKARAAAKYGAVDILFDEGVYNLDKTLELGGKDSGAMGRPITYKAAEGAEVVFSGAKRLRKEDFETVTDPDILNLVPYNAVGKILEYDLSKIGITADDARYASTSIRQKYKKNGFYNVSLNGRVQDVSQYPNGATHYEYWTSVAQAGSGTTDFSDKSRWGIFEYSGTRPKRWTNAKHAWIMVHTENDFANTNLALMDIDINNKLISVATEVMQSQPFTTNQKSHRWKVYNLIEEMDIPGEWYIDSDTNKFYYYPPSTFSVDDDLELSVLDGDIVRIDSGEYISFDGISFENSRRNAIYICNNSSDISISNCKMSNIERVGVMSDYEHAGYQFDYALGTIGYSTHQSGSLLYQNASKNITVDSCRFYEIGNQAIFMYGTGTVNLTNCNNVISNNYMTNCNMRGTAMDYVIYLQGCGYTVKNNLIHNTNDGAVMPFTENTKILWNEFYNGMRQTADCAAIYQGYNEYHLGNEQAYNLIYDMQPKDPNVADSMQQGIYIDIAFGEISVHHNFIENTSYGILSNIGKRWNINNNVISETRYGPMSFLIAANRPGEIANFERDHTTEVTRQAASLQSYGKRAPVLYEGIKGERLWYSWLLRVNDNISVFKEELPKSSLEKPYYIDYVNGSWSNNEQLDYSRRVDFVDPDHMDYRIKSGTETAKRFPDALTDSNCSMSDFGPSIDYSKVNDQSFLLKYPDNNDTDVKTTDLTLVWDRAIGADGYRIKIARDSQMSDIVETADCDDAYYVPTNVEIGRKTYYWTVEAVNKRRHFETTWNADNVYSFTTADNNETDTTDIDEALVKAKQALETIEDGVNYEQGTYDTVKAKIDEIERTIKTNDSLTKFNVDYMVNDLKNTLIECSYKQIIGFEEVDSWIDESMWRGDNSYEDKIDIKVQDGVLTIQPDEENSTAYMGAITTRRIKNNNNLYKFKIKNSYLRWFVINLNVLDDSCTEFKPNQNTMLSSDSYNLIVDSSFTITKRLREGFKYYAPRRLGNADEWVNVSYGAIETLAGVRLILMCEDKVVMDYLDTTNPVVNDSKEYFVQIGCDTRNAAVSIAKADESYKPSLDGYEGGKIVDIFPFSNGSWSECKENSENKVSWEWNSRTALEATAFYMNRIEGEGGDSNAKLTITYDPDPNASSDEIDYVYNVDFTDGETGWIQIAGTTFKRMIFTLESSGNGKLLVDRNHPFGFFATTEDSAMKNDFFKDYDDAVVFGDGVSAVLDNGDYTAVDKGKTEILDGEYYTPVSILENVYGFTADYGESNVKLSKDGKTIEFADSNRGYTINGEKHDSSKALLKDGVLMVPIKALAEITGKYYYQYTYGIVILSDKLDSKFVLVDKFYNALVKALTKKA